MTPHDAPPTLYYLVTGNVLAGSDPRLREPSTAVLGVCRDGESAAGWRPMRPGEEPARRKAAGRESGGCDLAGMGG